MVGTVIMMHADDDGLVLPPRIAPTHIVIIPVMPKPETRDAVLAAANALATQLRAIAWRGAPVQVHVDERDLGGGVKNWEWIKKGVPLRVELGPRDLETGSVAVSRRDGVAVAGLGDPGGLAGARTPESGKPATKTFLPGSEFVRLTPQLLDSIQQSLFDRALAFRDANTRRIDTKEEFYEFFTPKNAAKPEIHGGFALAHWNGSRAVEEQIKNDLKVTIRCIPFDDPGNPPESGKCIITDEPSLRRVLWAKSY